MIKRREQEENAVEIKKTERRHKRQREDKKRKFAKIRGHFHRLPIKKIQMFDATSGIKIISG